MNRVTRRVVLLGSTGSIGTQTLDVLGRLNAAGRRFDVVGLAAGTSRERLVDQLKTWRPSRASLREEKDAAWVRERCPGVDVLSGEGSAAALASQDADVVVNAVVGAAGLSATLAALGCGRTVALANKESLVIGGELVTRALGENGGRLLPVDSEHSALLQALDAGRREDVHRLILTASGGPFLDVDLDSLDDVTAAQALRHPTWSMGPRITIDSATLVNKAFEVVEAHYLYGVPYERIDVLIHPSAIVHSLVEYGDGSVMAQLAPHDMRIPIQYALTYPERVDTGIPRLDLASVRRLEFRSLPPGRFPAFDVVLSAARLGGTALAAVNAADETLVARFLRGEVPFGAISHGLSKTLDAWERAPIPRNADHIEAILAADRWARAFAAAYGPRL